MWAPKTEKMKTTKFQWLCIAIAATICSSCDEGRTLPSATGSIYDCLVVAPSTPLNAEQRAVIAEAYPNTTGSSYVAEVTDVQQLVSAVLNETMPCMPQAETYFKTTCVRPQDFDNFLKPTRNLLIVDVDPHRYTQTRIRYQNDLYSHPQAVVRIQAASTDSLVAWWLEHGTEVRTWIVEREMDRAKTYLRGATNGDVRKALKKMEVDMLVPSDYTLIKDSDNFVWCCNNKGPMRKDIIVYRQPYTDALQLTLGELLDARDRIVGGAVSAAEAGSHMGTEYKTLPPVISAIPYGAEVRGLWRMYDGPAMGGPFVSRSIVDASGRWVVTAETFVFAPGQKKRSALRQAEAILRTMTSAPKEDNEKK